MASNPEAIRAQGQVLKAPSVEHWPWAMTFTWLRIGCVPLLSLLWLASGASWAVLSVLICACASDWLDGFLARRLNQCSELGAFLDPVADKLMVVSALLLLLSEHASLTAPILVIVIRELTVSALRAWRSPDQLRVDRLGKAKTAIQMLSLFLLVLADVIDSGALFSAGLVALWGAALLSVASLANYLRRLAAANCL
jgi:CDP-diacylglycerol--glycerol-3-phosphate 3-phosphatidyltransferase